VSDTANEWKRWPVADLQSEGMLLVEDGNHGEYRPRREEYGSEGVPFIRIPDMGDGYVDFVHADKIGPGARARIRKGVGAPGDVLISHKGTIGKVAFAPLDSPEFVCSPQTTFWRSLDTDRIDQRFLYYSLQSPDFQAQLDSRKNETDMAGYVSLTSQRSLSVLVPSIEIQRSIGRTLGSLDEKIALNRRMSETLELIAQALFRSWFVDFDPVCAKADRRWRKGETLPGMPADTWDLWPSEFEDSEIGEIPKNWTLTLLDTVLSIDRGVSYKGEGLVESGRPMINLGCFAGRGRFREEKVKRYGGDFRSSHVAKVGDLLLANTDITQQRVVLGSPVIVPSHLGNCIFSHHVYGLRFKEEQAETRLLVYYNFLQPPFRERAEGYATGTTVLFLPQDAILKSTILTPPASLLRAFNQIVGVLRQAAETAGVESKTLGDARDTLLPELLSGELRVPVDDSR
jgi:type I restriction enzyme S subunit